METTNKQSKSLTDYLNQYKELIAIIINLVSFSVLFLTRSSEGGNARFLIYVEVLNILILLFGFIFLMKEHKLSDGNPENERKTEDPNKPENKEDNFLKSHIGRINAAVGQLKFAIKGFTLLLLCLYFLLLLFDSNSMKEDTKSIEYNSKCCPRIDTARLMVGDSVKYQDSLLVASLTNSNSLTELAYKELPAQSSKTIKFLVVSIIDNIFNIYSASFLYIAFSILFIPTINEKTNDGIIATYFKTFIGATILIIFNIGTVIIGIGNLNLMAIVAVSRILSGMYNAIGMAMLFSRFISIEFFLKKGNTLKNSFYLAGTTFFLPLYAVVQPLWGLFDTGIMSDNHLLKSIVLLICLWGKVFFYLFLYFMLSEYYMHRYLYYMIWTEKHKHFDTINLQLNKLRSDNGNKPVAE